MRKLVAFFVDRSLLVNLITVGVCLFGAIVAGGMPRVLLPEIKPRTIDVEAELPGASALDVERFVTFRLEEALEGMRSVQHVISTTTNGKVAIEIEFAPDVEDMTKPLEETQSRLGALQHILPRDLRPLSISERQVRNTRVLMELVVENVDEKNATHREAVKSFAERLARIPSIVEVDSTLRDMDLYVRLSREALAKQQLSVELVRRRIFEFFDHMPVGAVQVRDQDVAVQLDRQTVDLEALRQLPLRLNRVGEGVYLGDVAQIGFGFEQERARSTLDGRRFVELTLFTALGSDVIDSSRRVRDVLEAESATLLPAPLASSINVDVSEVIEHEMSTLQGNGFGGVLIVLLILMLFLGWRISAMTALGLPFCYLGMIIVLHLFGVTFNLISLVAMILVVGILVDDAIIVSEEFTQHCAAGMSPRSAAITAVSRVAKPVLGMVATTSVAFAPLLLLKGTESWLIRPLPLVVIAALLLSLFESFFLLPNHLRHFIGQNGPVTERRPVVWAREAFGHLLAKVLRLRYLTLVAVAGLFALTAFLLMGPVKVDAKLSLSSEAYLYIELPKAAESLDALAKQIKPVEEAVKKLPPGLVKRSIVHLGAAMPPNGRTMVRGWKYAALKMTPPGSFVDQELKRREIGRLLGPQLAQLKKRHGLAKLRLMQDTSSEVRDVVTIYVSGGDRIAFDEIQDQIRATLDGIEQIQDVFMDDARFQRSFSFRVDNNKAMSYELDKRQVHAQLREHFSNSELLQIRSKGEEIEVFLRFADQKPPTLARLNQIRVVSGRGVAVPLRYLGSWTTRDILRRIEHRDLLRMFQIDVLYDRKKIDSSEVAELIEGRLTPLRERYRGYHISVKPSEAEAETRRWMLRLLAICVGLIYLCLALALGSLVQPVVVIFAIPFGFAGVVLAFYLHGMDLGLMAIIGTLGLAGVVVNDSLVMTSTINRALKSDPSGGLRAAVVAGAKSRFRAVVLTSLTTLGGVFPLAYGLAGKAGWLQPMVLAVGWGLLFATVVTLLFIPCLLLMIDDARRVGRRLLRLVRPN